MTSVNDIVLFLRDFISYLWLLLLTFLQSLFRLVVWPPKKSVVGHNVLVTGAGQGIGRELALEFARRGANLILWDINETAVKKTASEILEQGVKATAYVCDVSLKDEVIKTSQQVFRDYGQIDILVNNAGVLPTVKPFLLNNHKDLERIVNVNLLGNFWMIEAFLPQMLARREGHLVAISSMAGRQGFPYLVSYCTTKFGVAGLMEALSDKLKYDSQNDIHLTTVFPSIIKTPLYHHHTQKVKLPWFVPLTKPEAAAKAIVNGVQRNASSIFIPSSSKLADFYFRLSPRKIKQLIFNAVGVEFLDNSS